MVKLPARYNAVAIPVVLSGMMSFLVSGIATFKAIGAAPAFFAHWLSSWTFAWPIAAVTAILALPLARWIVEWFVEAPVARPPK